ncbi:MAG: DUF1934 domain-containing protein [Oscillospiraceae bacterium]|nr:DUF1934 domain-containing protein [Oscillospiraceae bacterium]
MKQEVDITIRSAQVMDGESDEMELSTLGSLYEKDGLHYLSYDESEVTGFEGHSTVLKLGPGRCVTMNRYGKANSKLIIELDECNSCLYNTEFGSMDIDVRGRQHELSILEGSGRLFLAYTLDLGAGINSYNEIEVSWKATEK